MSCRTEMSVVALALMLGLGAASAQQVSPPAVKPEAPRTPLAGQIVTQPEESILARDLIGQSVNAPDNTKIGNISDLVMSKDGRTVEGFVIGVGGFLGIGEKDVGVPFKALEFRTEAEMQRSEDGTAKETDERRTDARDARFDAEHGDIVIVLATTKEDLEAAPDFAWLDEQDADSVKREQVVR